MSAPSSTREVRDERWIFVTFVREFPSYPLACLSLFQIFAYKDNIPSQVGDEKRKQPVKPRSAFMCFTDAKKKELLERNGLKVDDIGLWELNEAFASQVIYCADTLGIDYDRLNVNGGAIAIGHPFGMSGARMVGQQWWWLC